MQKVVVIGAGIAGIAAAIRLAVNGMKVTVLESNSYPGGKLSEIHAAGFRFDAGPSLFTMPHFVDELFELAGKNPRDFFNYHQLSTVCHYFYPSGNQVNAYADEELRIAEFSQKFNEKPETLQRYFNYSKRIYDITHEVFLENSLHRVRNFLNFKTLKSALNLGKIDAFRNQNEANASFFQHPELVQLFNRYATYNGSNPYQAPATLNVIPHFEYGFGAFLPVGGMHTITQSLYELALDLGVSFHFETKATQIKVVDKKVKGVATNDAFYEADVVFSNVDVWFTYQNLLAQSVPFPQKIKKQERSSSALIFYWGVQKSFAQLGVHNIFFSENYQQEFEAIFTSKTIVTDPTVYINITSKVETDDAPSGAENWFVMINVPHDHGQDWEANAKQAKVHILKKLEQMLGESIENQIVYEQILDPKSIETKTGSYVGSLYGSSSNNQFAAFLRHPNFSSNIKGLYFCGGSVHPGGGIPLALLSAKIATKNYLK